jgi:hypothetical protein
MKFFVPQVAPGDFQATYEGIVKAVKDQLRIPIVERKIFSINYIHDKKPWRAEVGQLDPEHGRYKVVAIFEAKPYIVYTRALNGDQGITILVSGDEISAIEDFSS